MGDARSARASHGAFDELRLLAPGDAETLMRLRLRALREHPRAFLSSEEEDAAMGVEGFASRLAQPRDRAFTLGGFVAGDLVAMAGVARAPHRKTHHRAFLWGVYVASELRRRALGRSIVAAAIEHARAMGGLETLALSVDAESSAAIALYRSLGFEPWGTERDAFRTGHESVTEMHMTRSLE